MRIGITGASGMLGWHMRCYLTQFAQHSVVLGDRLTFGDNDRLCRFVSACDAIVHFAGKNRGDDSEIEETNIGLAKALISACSEMNVTPHIVHSSSTHEGSASAYGRSKADAARQMRQWAKKVGGRFTNLVLPHVFGEGTRPFYNSAAATFAYQLAVGEKPKVINDVELELVHAQDVCAEVRRRLESSLEGDIRITGQFISVRHLLLRLRQLSDHYRMHLVPDLRDVFDLRLFNLHRSYLFPGSYPRHLQPRTDERGSLVEAVKTFQGGQVFYSSTKPGITRGNHFHYRKVERFLVLQGTATIRVRRLFDDIIHTFEVTGNVPAYVDMPTLHTHDITNIGDDDLVTLFWTNEIFDPADPDTVGEPVSKD